MIDLNEVREPFRERIDQSGIFGAGEINWENLKFNPSQKSIWMQETYSPVAESFLTSQYDLLEGIFRYKVFGSVNSSKGDTEVNAKALALANLFTTAEIIETDNYKISLDSTSRGFQGRFDDKWYMVAIDINFRAYEV